MPAGEPWDATFRLIDEHPQPEGLLAHSLGPLAVAHSRKIGRPVTPAA